MDLNALSSLIATMRPSFRSPEQQQLDAIGQAWTIALGEPIATHARPIRYERDRLTIAVRQASWAQQLTAQTHQILQQLRQHLPPDLTIQTLRFRVLSPFDRSSRDAHRPHVSSELPAHPSQWPVITNEPTTQTPPSQPLKLDPTLDPNRASSINPDPSVTPLQPHDPLQQVVQRWRSQLNQHASSLSACPQCHCLTPPAELDRWGLCALCATIRFQSPMALGGQLYPPKAEPKPPDDDTKHLGA